MTKRYVPFGASKVDQVVKDFFARHGIDPADVIGYTITRGTDDIGTITFSMLFEDETDDAEVTALDYPVRTFLRTGGTTYTREH